MANEIRIRQGGLGGLVEDNPLTASATLLTTAGLAAVSGGVDSSHHLPVILDPDGIIGPPEIAYVTSLTAGAGATGATGLLRGQEGTTARQHDQDTPWLHGPTPRDYIRTRESVRSHLGDVSITSTTRTPVDATNLPFLTVAAEVGDIVECTLSFMSNTSGGSTGFVDVEVDQPTSANTYVANANAEGLAKWINQVLPITAVGVFVVTERGSHGFRPVAWRSGGTAAVLHNAASGTGDLPISFVVKNLGPPAD